MQLGKDDCPLDQIAAHLEGVLQLGHSHSRGVGIGGGIGGSEVSVHLAISAMCCSAPHTLGICGPVPSLIKPEFQAWVTQLMIRLIQEPTMQATVVQVRMLLPTLTITNTLILTPTLSMIGRLSKLC